MGVADPAPENLRVEIGKGLTGWVAAHKRTLRIGDAAADQRSVQRGEADQPESMLVVPMLYEDAVHGVIVISRIGRDQFDADDETTFSIFAGYAALALVNASNLGRLEQHQAELQHQLRASVGCWRSTNGSFDARAEQRPRPIADSLKAIVPYDSLTVYRVDREAGVRRAVIARDQFADLILANENALVGGLTKKLTHGKRFREIIVGPDFEADDAVDLLTFRGEQENRHGRLRSQRAADRRPSMPGNMTSSTTT